MVVRPMGVVEPLPLVIVRHRADAGAAGRTVRRSVARRGRRVLRGRSSMPTGRELWLDLIGPGDVVGDCRGGHGRVDRQGAATDAPGGGPRIGVDDALAAPYRAARRDRDRSGVARRRRTRRAPARDLADGSGDPVARRRGDPVRAARTTTSRSIVGTTRESTNRAITDADRRRADHAGRPRTLRRADPAPQVTRASRSGRPAAARGCTDAQYVPAPSPGDRTAGRPSGAARSRSATPRARPCPPGPRARSLRRCAVTDRAASGARRRVLGVDLGSTSSRPCAARREPAEHLLPRARPGGRRTRRASRPRRVTIGPCPG